jgi:hypothetical protein
MRLTEQNYQRLCVSRKVGGVQQPYMEDFQFVTVVLKEMKKKAEMGNTTNRRSNPEYCQNCRT